MAKVSIDEYAFNQFQSVERRYPVDQQLRKRGYSIYARPNNKPPMWVKRGKLYRQLDMDSIILEEVGCAD